MDKIKLDPRNVRLHDQQNKQAISKSLKELGAGRSILVDNDNIIIGGNGVYEQAQGLGLPVRVIESDGTELIAIKRTDLASDDAKRKALAIADNKLNDMSFFDFDALKAELDQINIDDFDLSITGFQDFELGFLNNMSQAADTEETTDVKPAMSEYQNMPEYKQQDADPYRLIVHFRSLQDKIDFSEVVNQKILENTKSIWIPRNEPIDEKNYVCKSE